MEFDECYDLFERCMELAERHPENRTALIEIARQILLLAEECIKAGRVTARSTPVFAID